jgi:D-alanyl-lipoteichoic acid acyltransferase DltB (MBOAT superfamily)
MIILLHLRKIILMSCVAFSVCDLIEELLESLRPQSQLVRHRKKYEIQPWIHIYIVYIYMFVTLSRGPADRFNAFELPSPTS